MVDMVNHPPHYTTHPSGVECITITRHMGFNVGNAVKYLWRCDTKGNAIQDLEKAAFYIADEIAKRKGMAWGLAEGTLQPQVDASGTPTHPALRENPLRHAT